MIFKFYLIVRYVYCVFYVDIIFYVNVKVGCRMFCSSIGEILFYIKNCYLIGVLLLWLMVWKLMLS